MQAMTQQFLRDVELRHEADTARIGTLIRMIRERGYGDPGPFWETPLAEPGDFHALQRRHRQNGQRIASLEAMLARGAYAL